MRNLISRQDLIYNSTYCRRISARKEQTVKINAARRGRILFYSGQDS